MTLLLPDFREFASIGGSDISIYGELLIYALLLVVCGFIAGSILVLYAQRQVLNESIKGGGSPGSRNTFRKGSLLVQLTISLVMIFCAFVFIKQIRFLHTTDLGINRHNIATVSGFPIFPHYADQITQVPGVIDAIPINWGTLRPTHSGSHTHSFIDNAGNPATVNLFTLIADNRFFDFFGVNIIEGRKFYNDINTHRFLLNETADRLISGGTPSWDANNQIGIFQDFYFFPTERARPTKIHYPTADINNRFQLIAYRYEEGMREQTEEAVRQWVRENVEMARRSPFPIVFTYMEDVFNEAFRSERALLRLLSLMTLVSVLIAIFGVYSLVSLTCQQRRKEIAIRKINGAEVFDIMNIFFKEYLILLAISAAVAFPTGFIIMRRWLEDYVKQTSMDAWIFVLIFLVMFAVIVLSILSTVWRAANQNPAEVVKSE